MLADAQRPRAIDGFRLTTHDLPRLFRFYQEVLGFASAGPEQAITPDEIALLGLRRGGRRQTLRLGAQVLGIDLFDAPGRPYPIGSNAASLWFQHLALVVPDIAEAYQRVRGATAISEGGPQHLPPSSGSVHAFKFRDPDGHPLELLQFPTDDRPAPWKGQAVAAGQIGLGVDHSAISVADADASAAFYVGIGLGVGDRTINQGPPQQRLDALHDVRVAVVPMLPPEGTPHLELLGYQVPRGTAGPALAANDIAATRIVWRGTRPALLRDPDGHLHQIEPPTQEPSA
jgi:catechol 2,3-dioxygenase-like lactoylglutathione lyase family enzyme